MTTTQPIPASQPAPTNEPKKPSRWSTVLKTSMGVLGILLLLAIKPETTGLFNKGIPYAISLALLCLGIARYHNVGRTVSKFNAAWWMTFAGTGAAAFLNLLIPVVFPGLLVYLLLIMLFVFQVYALVRGTMLMINKKRSLVMAFVGNLYILSWALAFVTACKMAYLNTGGLASTGASLMGTSMVALWFSLGLLVWRVIRRPELRVRNKRSGS